jgi:hypothetical protein
VSHYYSPPPSSGGVPPPPAHLLETEEAGPDVESLYGMVSTSLEGTIEYVAQRAQGPPSPPSDG